MPTPILAERREVWHVGAQNSVTKRKVRGACTPGLPFKAKHIQMLKQIYKVAISTLA